MGVILELSLLLCVDYMTVGVWVLDRAVVAHAMVLWGRCAFTGSTFKNINQNRF